MMPIRSSKVKRILILGDSTSSSLGRSSKVWSKQISNRDTWVSGIEFVDTSCPGNTASSAVVSFLLHILRNPFKYRAVVLYVGNCDRITKPYRTNDFGFIYLLSRAMLLLLNIPSAKKYEWNKLSPFSWNSNFDINREKNGKIEDFEKKLILLRRLCRFFRVTLIPVIPRANRLFVPGSAKGNFLYYRAINSFEDWEHLEESGLYQALNCKIDQALDSQMNNIRYLITGNAEPEKIYCAINNYAVSLNSKGNYSDAIKILELISNDSSQRVEIFTYNLAQIYLGLGNYSEYNSLMSKALTLDRNSYRIDDIHSEIVSKVFSNNSLAIDLRSHKYNDSMFIDHCHLNEEGQTTLATEILHSLQMYQQFDGQKAKLTNKVLNPEIVNGDSRPWNIFFGIEVDLNIDSKFSTENALTGFEGLDLQKVLASNKFSHPNFEYLQSFPKRLLERFERYPEILCSLIPVALMSSLDKPVYGIFPHHIERELRETQNLISQLRINLSGEIIFNLKKIEDDAWELIIMNRVLDGLEQSINVHQDRDLRIRTIMHWYFRESMMFGFQSDTNSYFNRDFFRQIIESLSIVFILKSNRGDSYLELPERILELTIGVIEKMNQIACQSNIVRPLADFFLDELELIRKWRAELEGYFLE
jgi:hypothetical protein